MRGTGIAQKLIDRVRTMMKPAKPTCTVCGRPLYSKDSMARGMGAICYGRHWWLDP